MSSRYMLGKSKTARDEEYIRAYLETHSQFKAAELCGVSRETIARACRRANIKLDGRKYNRPKYNNGSNHPNPIRKITDDQLIEEAKVLNCVEIARKYSMSAEQVYRRARNLGLDVNCVGGGGHYRRRLDNYGDAEYDGSVTLKRVREKYSDICQICGKLVDDTAIENGHIKRMYPTIDHIIPLSKGGTHTWGNVQLAHMSCNAGKCDKVNK